MVCLVVVVVAAGAWWLFWRTPESAPTTFEPSQGEAPAAAAASGNAGRIRPARPTTKPGPPKPRGTTEQRAQAKKEFEEGMRLHGAGNVIPARSMLSRALLTGFLAEPEQAQAVAVLTAIADKMVFSIRIHDGDPYALLYTFKNRDRLINVARDLKLHLPWEGLLRINALRSAKRIKAGQTLKMVKGPCHSIVYKQPHVMDVYLRREGMDMVFLRRMRVGLGAEDTTPVGPWRVVSRLTKPVYNPTPRSGLKKSSIRYGEPNYAFGRKGLWIGLQGTGENTEGRTGYGIHSTNDPDSIGRNASEGCIRLGDDDIDLIYALLKERHSTVEIRP